jgi:tetratricopeptide (TPR) repeat protein
MRAPIRTLVICSVLTLPMLAFAAGGGGGGSWTPPAAVAEKIDLAAEFRAGLVAIEKTDYKSAVQHFRVVAKDQPKNADAQNYLGYAYRKNGDRKNALKYYEKALKLNPNHPGANEYLGELYLEMKDVPKAEARLAVLSACCAANAVTKQLGDAIAEYKAGGSFTAKPPLITY